MADKQQKEDEIMALRAMVQETEQVKAEVTKLFNRGLIKNDG